MLKKKLLFSLVIIQGILILAGIIAIVLGIFYKFNKSPSSLDKINQNIDLSQIFLLDENYYQQKIIENNQVIFQIIETKSLYFTINIIYNMSNLFVKKAAILALLISCGSVEGVKLQQGAFGKSVTNGSDTHSLIA